MRLRAETVIRQHDERQEMISQAVVDDVKDPAEEASTELAKSSKSTAGTVDASHATSDRATSDHPTTFDPEGETLSTPQSTITDAQKLVLQDCQSCRTVYPLPALHTIRLWLHALSYESPDWKFETKMPGWAQDDFNDQPDLDSWALQLQRSHQLQSSQESLAGK